MRAESNRPARRSGWSYVAALVVYSVVASAIFGDPISPILRLLLWRPGVPDGLAVSSILGGLLIATAVIWLARRRAAAIGSSTLAFQRNYEPATFVAVALIAWLIIAGTVAWLWRDREIARFEPDRLKTASFVSSLRHAPAEFQFFLHAAALKNCQAYAWSYREMAFYRLPPNVAVNVLPRAWLEECGIVRQR